VTGTLDVHSQKTNAFTPEDVTVIQSLGDQIAIAIENARLYERSKKLAVMEERNRLARDLHDSVTQSIYSMGLLIEGWRQTVANGEAVNVDDLLYRTREINEQVLREMRLLIHELRPPILEEEGLLNALQKRMDAVENRAGISARIVAEDFINVPRDVEEGLYRISLEALNNALKHSQASQVTIQIYSADERICLKITDNGCGFDLEKAFQAGGMGLKNMRERAHLLRGDLDIQSQPGAGTEVRVCMDAGDFKTATDSNKERMN
jgi:signal transduction histidine kinase